MLSIQKTNDFYSSFFAQAASFSILPYRRLLMNENEEEYMVIEGAWGQPIAWQSPYHPIQQKSAALVKNIILSVIFTIIPILPLCTLITLSLAIVSTLCGLLSMVFAYPVALAKDCMISASQIEIEDKAPPKNSFSSGNMQSPQPYSSLSLWQSVESDSVEETFYDCQEEWPKEDNPKLFYR